MNQYLPMIAILISIFSLSVSIFLAWRDRGRLKASCIAYTHQDTGEYSYLRVKAVNLGRRPIALRYLWGNYEGNNQSGYELSLQKSLLNESEFYEESIGKFDGMMMFTGEHGELNEELIDLFFEDTKGKKYKVKKSKEMVSKLWGSIQPLGPKTHS